MIPGITAGWPFAVTPPDPGDAIAMSIARKLASWYDFENNTLDVVAANHLSGTASYAAGKVGQKVVKGGLLNDASFRWFHDMVSVGNRFSMGGWMFIKGTSDEDFMEVFDSGNLAHYIALRSSGTLVYYVASQTVGGSVTVPPAGISVSAGWNFVMIQFDSGTKAMELYVGDPTTPAATGTMPNTPRQINRLQLGRQSGTVYNAIDNDSCFVAGDWLDEDERVWLYNAGAGRGVSEIPAHSRGAWTWFNDPRALEVGSGVAVGATDPEGRILVYSGTPPLAPSTAVQLHGTASPDDHDNPAFLRRASDGRILAFAVRHHVSDYHLSVSVNPDDVSSFSAPVNIASQLGTSSKSYANPVQLTGETDEPIYLFFRYGPVPTYTLHMSKSLDGGTTWSAATPLMGGQRPYVKVARNGNDRIDFLVTDGHPGETSNNGVYHFYYQGGGYFDSFGVSLGSAPFLTSSMTQLWDGTTADGIGWIWDLCIGPDGYPVAVYSNFPTTSDHRYRYARFNGSAWVQSEVCAAGGPLYAGEPYYSGGICIDRSNVNRVFASREVSGKFKLYEYLTADSGASFDGGALLFEPTWDCFRPYHIEGTDQLSYVMGFYNTYSDYQTRVMLLDI